MSVFNSAKAEALLDFADYLDEAAQRSEMTDVGLGLRWSARQARERAMQYDPEARSAERSQAEKR